MRYRRLSDSGDYVFGQGAAQFLVNSPATVAQAVNTRLLLPTEEWFLDLLEGTPYKGEVLGYNTVPVYDAALQARILGTPGVSSIDAYSSVLTTDRKLQISVTITTIYGQATVATVF